MEYNIIFNIPYSYKYITRTCNWNTIPNWQKESWQTFEETSRYVRPERVNKWPIPWQKYDDDVVFTTRHCAVKLALQ